MLAPGPIRIEQVADDAAAQWDAFVRNAPAASIYHRYAWRGVIQRVFARDTFYFAAREGARICGVLPVTRLKSTLFGHFLISMPYLNYGGTVGETPEIERLLVEHASDLAEDLGVRFAFAQWLDRRAIQSHVVVTVREMDVPVLELRRCR